MEIIGSTLSYVFMSVRIISSGYLLDTQEFGFARISCALK
jgi:hypothetical protein